jgi:uncharacterized pyridoxamine 5'-phosphate oxidase family protein
MHESEKDLEDFQRLLINSRKQVGPHVKKALELPLKSLTARQLSRLLQGIQNVFLAAVTTSGTPQITPEQALFYRAHFYLPMVRTSLRVRHMMHEPSVSMSMQRGDDFTLIMHGKAVIIDPSNDDTQEEFRYVEELHKTYTSDVPSTWKNGCYVRIDPFMFLTRAKDPTVYAEHSIRRKKQGQTTDSNPPT